MGNWNVPLPTYYQDIPPVLNMAEAICHPWLTKGNHEDTAIIFGDQKISFIEIHSRMLRCANALIDLGIRPGDAIVLRSPNHPNYVVAVLACLWVGALPVLSNSLLGPRELQYIIENSDAKAIFTTEDRLEALIEILPACSNIEHIYLFDGEFQKIPSFDDLLSTSPCKLDALQTKSEDPAFMLYTSGTTGTPKGIIHAHRWIVATGDSVGHLMLKLHPGDLSWNPAEFSFMYSLGQGLMHCLYMRTTIYIHNKRFEPSKAIQTLKKRGITIFSTVPTAYRMILASTDPKKNHNLENLRLCVSSGETLPPETYREWKALVSCDIIDGLGVSELQKFCVNLDQEPIKPGSAGKVLPGYIMEIHDDDGKPVLNDEVGRVAIRDDCPGLFVEYRKMPKAWEENHIRGWYYTGDLGRFDEDGYFWYVSRKDDLIKSRGYMISPKEIEEACLEHSGVIEAGVIGVPDEEIGFRIKAYVILKNSLEPSVTVAEEIRNLIRKRIALYKVPKTIEFVSDLPKTHTGKIKRNILRKEAEKEEQNNKAFQF